MDFDLALLEDYVFEVHEEVIADENVLFRIDQHMESVMRSNAAAKRDGVFRGRLSADLRQKKTNWEAFWKLSNSSQKQATVQYLFAPDDPNARYCMNYVAADLEGSSAFLKKLSKAQSLENPSPTCCSEVLRKEGPKKAVKHFFETLISKSIVIPNYSRPAEGDNISSKKTRFNDRQRFLQEQNPSDACALIEQSMKSNEYKANDPEKEPHVREGCDCRNCHFHHQFEAVNCKPENLNEDGDGRNCSLYLTSFEEDCEKYLFITSNFAMSHLCHLNMLTDLDSYYAGISFPFVYVAGLHSFFPIHVEDMSLPSINYLHMGHPKFWVVVAPSEIMKLSITLSKYGLHNLHRVCLFKLNHKSSVVFPQLLLHHDIKFKIIIQEPGDFIFLAPNAAHTGGNMGINLAEACNIGTMDWLPYGSVASTQNCSCLEHQVHMDITPLLTIHRKDLLKYHNNGTMSENFTDFHFKRSIIDLRSIEPVQVACSLSSPVSSISAEKGKVIVRRERVSCPVEDCLKAYQIPLKKETIMKHIEQEHPKHAKQKQVLEAIDSLCCKVSRRTAKRYTCSDCGTEISINSNRHKGSKACKARSAKAMTMPQNPLPVI